MSLTIAGRNEMVKCLVGIGTPFNSVNSVLCVGNGDTAFDANQTDLQGSITVRKPLDAGYPIVEDNSITVKATFSGTEVNCPWNEWGIANDILDGTLLNRVVEYNGTKLEGQTWILQVTLTTEIGS